MSMIRCEWCERLIDSDDDPDCFAENPEEVLCEWCRDKRYAEQTDPPPEDA